MRKIAAEQRIVAHDQNKLFVEKASARRLSPADAEDQALKVFFSPEVVRVLGEARRLLTEYLSDEETEHVSEREIDYWSPTDAAAK